MSEWWEKGSNEEGLEGVKDYAEKKLELTEELGKKLSKDELTNHLEYDEEQVELFEANFPWADISFEDYLLLEGKDVDWFVEIYDKLITKDPDLTEGEKKEWHEEVKNYNRKALSRYKGFIDVSTVHKWLIRNRDFEQYIEYYNKKKEAKESEYSDLLVYNKMLKDFLVHGAVPPMGGTTLNDNVYFDEKSMSIRKNEQMEMA